MSFIFSAWTVVVMFLFIGITLWAWSSRNRENFEAASRIPFEEEQTLHSQQKDEGLNNG